MANLNEHDIINMTSNYGKEITLAIESAYGLKIHGYSPVSQISFTSKKALIDTDQGMLFLKEKPFYSKGPHELFRSSTFQDYCAQRSGNFVEIIKSKDEESFLEFGDKTYFLTPYIEGGNFSGKQEELVSMLDTLTELKGLGKKYLDENLAASSIGSGTNGSINMLSENKSYDVILPFSLMEPMIRTEDDQIAFSRLKEALDILRAEFDAQGQDGIEYAMCHGDCILFNFQVLPDRTVLHDFDNAKVLPAIHDIAEFFVSSCLLNYAGSITNLKPPIFLTPHEDVAELMAYEISQRLIEKEKRLLPICIEIVWIWSLMLSVIKEDYRMSDLAPAIENIFQRTLHQKLVGMFNN